MNITYKYIESLRILQAFIRTFHSCIHSVQVISSERYFFFFFVRKIKEDDH